SPDKLLGVRIGIVARDDAEEDVALLTFVHRPLSLITTAALVAAQSAVSVLLHLDQQVAAEQRQVLASARGATSRGSSMLYLRQWRSTRMCTRVRGGIGDGLT